MGDVVQFKPRPLTMIDYQAAVRREVMSNGYGFTCAADMANSTANRPEYFKPVKLTLDQLPAAYPKECAKPTRWQRFSRWVRRVVEQGWCPHWSVDAVDANHDQCTKCDKVFKR